MKPGLRVALIVAVFATLSVPEGGRAEWLFAARRDFGVGDGPWSVATADFDGDGIADLAVANRGTDDVSVLLGNGDGEFPAAVQYGAGDYPSGVAVADFDGDDVEAALDVFVRLVE